jgi:hypothetical protein
MQQDEIKKVIAEVLQEFNLDSVAAAASAAPTGSDAPAEDSAEVRRIPSGAGICPDLGHGGPYGIEGSERTGGTSSG